MARLLSIGNRPGKCVLCGYAYDDLVVHAIATCSSQLQNRAGLWDTIVTELNVNDSVELDNMDDQDCVDIILGRKWQRLTTREYRDNFYCKTSGKILKMINVIKSNYQWYKV